MAPHREQIGIAGDDEIGAGRDGGGDHLIVIGIIGHYTRHFSRFHDLRGLDVISQYLAR